MKKYILYSLAMLLFGFSLSPLWLVVLSVWLSVGFYIKIKKLDEPLSGLEQKTFNYILLGYPFVETFLKFMIEKNVIPYSWFWLNRLEHIIFSMVIGILLLPFLKKTLSKLNMWEGLLYFVGIVVLIGNLNEFFEYGIRMFITNITNKTVLSAFYWDTIYDLAINVLGAVLGFILVKIIENKKSEKKR